MAAAGGGSSGFGGGGGGGGGGGFSGGGGGGGSGSGSGDPFAFLFVFGVFFALWISLTVYGLVRSARTRRRWRARAERVRTASAEAAEDDPAFDAQLVEAAAANLFREIQDAWNDGDRRRLGLTVGADLLDEWRLRLTDFDQKGWHNVVRVRGEPKLECVGLVNREDERDDRVVVHIHCLIEDWVDTGNGVQLNKTGESSKERLLDEFWTLGKHDGSWRLLSIEQPAEAEHHLDEDIVASPWGDEARMRDEALVQLASADKPLPGFTPGDLVEVDFAGDAHARALDLSLADPRFAPAVLEAAARRAASAWAEAVDGEDRALLDVASGDAVQELLHPGDPTGRTRLVVRGPKVRGLRVVLLEAEATPPRMTIELDLSGRRYVEDRDTAAVLSGSQEAEQTFTERWTMSLDGPDAAPWRIAATGLVASS
jgi:predicted lipid-binding transport protein (Tim44 family)